MDVAKLDHRFTIKIIIGMLLGMVVGLIFKYVPIPEGVSQFFVFGICKTFGQIFIHLIRMLVVPVVFVSLVCGASDLGGMGAFGRIGGKSLGLYLITTALAITLALIVASFFHVGHGLSGGAIMQVEVGKAPPISRVFIDMFPVNPFASLAEGEMLQIVVFSLLFGLTLTVCGKAGEKVANGFRSVNQVVIALILLIMRTAPYGVFFLLTVVFSTFGWAAVMKIMAYFFVVLCVLLLQLLVVYSVLLKVFARLSPWTFFRKMYSAMLFAFSVSSSNASIPVVLDSVKNKLGVHNRVASFVIPVGATINMDGTAIMQGVATVFIANIYGVHLGITGYLTVILMATLASIGTAGVPGVGLITLSMVLTQVGLPSSGIALIIGVDRILDMVRTAVNISGDAMISCIVGRSEEAMDEEIFTNG